MHWVDHALERLRSQLNDGSNPLTTDLLPCGEQNVDKLRKVLSNLGSASSTTEESYTQLDALAELAYASMSASKIVPTCWRRLYTDSCIFRVLICLASGTSFQDRTVVMHCIDRLDRSIITAGACGEGRLEFVQDLIHKLQTEALGFVRQPTFSSAHTIGSSIQRPNPPLSPETFAKSVTRLAEPPSFSAFISTYSKQPFIVSKYARDWPALQERPWGSADYLRSVAGPGRIVPVEVGSDYRHDEWTQKLMAFDEFTNHIFANDDAGKNQATLYLAQHNLFMQFPALRDVIQVPDYAYASLPPPEEFQGYKPPANEDQLIIHVWLGPVGAISPAHTDPFFNLFTQVVGRKTVWLAPPSVTSAMYPYPAAEAATHNPAANNINPSMSNTSKVDVFCSHGGTSGEIDYPLFDQNCVPRAMCAVLEPGDLLFFPPGWWHAMRSEETSFSVSMWF